MLSKLFGSKESFFTLKIAGVEQAISISSKETILHAALKQGIKFPHSCRVGGCAMCKCQLKEGKVKELTEKSYILSAEELQTNYILACQSLPKSDVSIAVDFSRAEIPEHVLEKTKGKIVAQNKLTHDIAEIVITTERPIEYTAGQFAELSVPDVTDLPRSYSFAQAPGKNDQELHFFVRAVPNGELSNWLLGDKATGTEVTLEGPYGDFYLRSGDGPMLCIAGGSGLAPVLSLLEDALIKGCKRKAVFLFGARSQKDLYCLEAIEKIAAQWQGDFKFVPVLSEEPEDSGWAGARGFVTAAMAEYCSKDHQLYMCGPPPMIDAAIDEAKKIGIEDSQIHFDKFLDRSNLNTL
ncbi:MAG TPA: 2Fe-2S iron-sulfur cluster binding domain-containing protein [Pseudomonadales bacterium]